MSLPSVAIQLRFSALLLATAVVMTIGQTDLPLRSDQRLPGSVQMSRDTVARPQFDLPLRYRIVEELSVGTAIADLVLDAGLKRKYTPEVLGQLEYRLLHDPAPVPLAVGLRTGLLTTIGRVDRDQLPVCREKPTCEVTIDITVQPGRYFQVIKVTLEILDINDNEPRFRDGSSSVLPSLPYPGVSTSAVMAPTAAIVEIRESASPGTSFALPVAIDPDGLEFSVRTYELVELTGDTVGGGSSSSISDTRGLFTLDIVARPHDQLEPRLIVARSPDREQQAEHRYRLVAYDGGRPPKSGSIDVVVKILDSNDNSPVFDVPTSSGSGTGYEVNVTENVAVGTPIARVRATDVDEGLNAEVVYRLSAHTQTLYGGLFSVDNRTGQITVIGQLDRERHAVYQLTVIAQDLGPDSMPVDAAVVVRVIDVNDNAPTISVNTLRSPTAAGTGNPSSGSVPLPGHRQPGTSVSGSVVAAEVPENLAAGTFVAHVSVADDDSGDFGRVDCNMTEAGAFSLVRRGRSMNEYQVLTAQPLDRELRDRYEPLVTCWDGGKPSLTGSVRLSVRITDTNDNKPRFGQPSYTGRVAENSPPGTVVMRIVANDLDLGINSEFHYALAAPTSSAQSSQSPLSIALTGSASGHGVVARDSPFRIDPEDGTITVSGVVTAGGGGSLGESFRSSPIDRERYSSFSFAVLAIDHGSPTSLTGSTVVVVAVDDVNDEQPVFGSDSYSFTIDENKPEGEMVGMVLASDADATRPNNLIAYQLTMLTDEEDIEHRYYERDSSENVNNNNNEERQLFVIDQESGVIRATKPLDREQQSVYHVEVVAVDQGRPAQLARTKVEIRVRDANDNNPIFDDPVASPVTISSMSPVGSAATRVSAADADDGDNGRVRYRITSQRQRLKQQSQQLQSKFQPSSNSTHPSATSSAARVAITDTVNRFAIDPDVGEIFVASPFMELSTETAEYVLTVRATDSGLPVRWAETEIHIIVNASVPYISHRPMSDEDTELSSWYQQTPYYHVTVVICVGAASAVVTIILLILIAVVRMRNRKSRDRRRQHCDDLRDRLGDVRRALTADSSLTVTAVVAADTNGRIISCSDDLTLPIGMTSESMPLALIDTGSRCSSPYSRSPCTMTSRAANGKPMANGFNGGVRPSNQELTLNCQQPRSAQSTPVFRPVGNGGGAENEHDSQHSGGECSNADSGRGHSCCGDDPPSSGTAGLIFDDTVRYPVSASAAAVSTAASGLTKSGSVPHLGGTCCVSGPSSKSVHYLPPPPPPRMAAPPVSYVVPMATTIGHASNQRPAWPSASATLPAHREAVDCRSRNGKIWSGPAPAFSAAAMTSSWQPLLLTTPPQPTTTFWSNTAAPRRHHASSALKQVGTLRHHTNIVNAVVPEEDAETVHCLEGRGLTTSDGQTANGNGSFDAQHTQTGNGVSVTWNSPRTGVIV